MKAICINNQPLPTTSHPGALQQLKEGEIYNVVESIYADGYLIKDIRNPNIAGFLKSRFILLSEIDETVLIN